MCAMIAIGVARAEKTGAWQGSPQHVLDWLQDQKMPGSPQSCCGIADAVNVEVLDESDTLYRLRVVNGRGHVADGTILFAGKDRQVRTNLDEDGNDVAWVNSAGHVYCLARAPKV
jgi:hypothetical protein